MCVFVLVLVCVNHCLNCAAAVVIAECLSDSESDAGVINSDCRSCHLNVSNSSVTIMFVVCQHWAPARIVTKTLLKLQ